MNNEIEIIRLREGSGNVTNNSKLVCFLYMLMRDEVPVGVIERLLLEVSSNTIMYTNGYLANYAENIAIRLNDKS